VQEARHARKLELVESKERSKQEAKDTIKEEAKEGKKISGAEKVRLEEALGQKFRGTPGFSGRDHSATGPRFLQALVKSKKDDNYELPPWEERCAPFEL